MLTGDENAKVTAAARVVPFTSSAYADTDFGTCLVSTVVDFQMHTTAVERALAHFEKARMDDLSTLGDFERRFAECPNTKDGNEQLAVKLFGYKMWTRVGLLRALVDFLRRSEISTFAELRAWASTSEYRDFEGEVRYTHDGRTYGLGPAVYNWLIMRLGVDTAKPDVRLRRFVERAIGRRASDADVVDAVQRAARELGIEVRLLDWSIWEMEA